MDLGTMLCYWHPNDGLDTHTHTHYLALECSIHRALEGGGRGGETLV